MNWDAIGAIGEIVGAIAVVATLFYLAVQIKHGVKIAESDAFERATKNFAETQSQLLDPRLGELFLRGKQNYVDLGELDKMQFDVLLSNHLFELEMALEKSRAGLIDEDYQTVFVDAFAELAASPGVKAYLVEKRHFHTKLLRDWADEHVN